MSYIDREAAIKATDELYNELEKNAASRDVLSAAAKAWQRIRALPAADVAPIVHARWIESEQWFGKRVQCSCCGYVPPHNGVLTSSFWKQHAKRCLACGALMQEADHA